MEQAYDVTGGGWRGETSGTEPGPETKNRRGRSYALFPVSLQLEIILLKNTHSSDWVKLSEGDTLIRVCVSTVATDMVLIYS